MQPSVTSLNSLRKTWLTLAQETTLTPLESTHQLWENKQILQWPKHTWVFS